MAQQRRLGNNILVITEAGSTASSTGRTSGSTIDMTGWDGALGIGIFDTTGAGNGVYWQDGTATGALGPTTGISDCAGSSIGIIDVYRPAKRYGGFVMTASGLSAKRSRLLTILYGPRDKPTAYASGAGATISALSTGVAVKFTASPASGNATA